MAHLALLIMISFLSSLLPLFTSGLSGLCVLLLWREEAALLRVEPLITPIDSSPGSTATAPTEPSLLEQISHRSFSLELRRACARTPVRGPSGPTHDPRRTPTVQGARDTLLYLSHTFFTHSYQFQKSRSEVTLGTFGVAMVSPS